MHAGQQQRERSVSIEPLLVCRIGLVHIHCIATYEKWTFKRLQKSLGTLDCLCSHHVWIDTTENSDLLTWACINLEINSHHCTDFVVLGFFFFALCHSEFVQTMMSQVGKIRLKYLRRVSSPMTWQLSMGKDPPFSSNSMLTLAPDHVFMSDKRNWFFKATAGGFSALLVVLRPQSSWEQNTRYWRPSCSWCCEQYICCKFHPPKKNKETSHL